MFSSPPKETLYQLYFHLSFSQALATTNLLCVSMLLPILDISYKWNINYVTFCVCLLSPKIMFSSFITVVPCISSLFLFVAKYLLSTYATSCLSLHFTKSVHQLLDIWVLPHIVTSINNAAMNIHVHIFVWTYILFLSDKYLRVE